MSENRVTFHQLEQALLRLGFVASTPNGESVVFRHPDCKLPVILPKMAPVQVLQPLDLLSVRNALANGGIVPKDEFQAIFSAGLMSK